MATENDRNLGQAVGVGQPNDPADVRRLQHLLNERQVHGGERLAEDGAFGPRTTMRLAEYQRDTVGLKRPDGVADPHGPTMRSLSGAAAEASHGKEAADANLHVSDYVASHPIGQPHETAKTKAWIEQALPAAQATRERWGVPVSVTLAQGALESSWGTSHPGGEYFGVKGHAPDGKSVSLATHEEKGGKLHGETDSFRSYGSLAESADDYGRFLATNKRYAAAFDHKDDANRFIHEVSKAKYATDSHYEGKVRSIIAAHDLTRYDSERTQNAGPAAPTAGPGTPHAPEQAVAARSDAGASSLNGRSGGPASQPSPPPTVVSPGDDHRTYWMAKAGIEREAAEARACGQTPQQAAGANAAFGAGAPDIQGAYWLRQAQAGREMTEANSAAAAQAQPATGTAQAGQTTEAAMPTIRLRQ